MITPHRQQGASLFMTVIFLILLGFFSVFALKVAPVYYNHYSVSRILNHLDENADKIKSSSLASQAQGPVLIKKAIIAQAAVNNIDLSNDNVAIKKDNSNYMVTVNFTSKTSLFYGIELLIHYNKSVILTNYGA